MSIRQILHEFRPLFRMLDQPFTRSPAFASRSRTLFDDPFFGFDGPAFLRPAVDVTEQGNKYILEADLPGVKKENLEVRIGDGGRSITIEGKLGSKQRADPSANVPAETDGSNQISVERPITSNAAFTRTVYLPRPVDSSSVVAKLTDGVLTITVPKAEDKASVVVPIGLD